MFCKECGKEIDNDSKFCSYCGTKQSLIKVSENIPNTRINPDTNTKNVNVSMSFGKPIEKREKNDGVEIDKYDRTYEGDSGASIAGFCIMIISLVIYFTVQIDNEEDRQIYIAISAVVNLIWRIIVIFWIVDISKRQNRDTIVWGIFAFFIPNLALIIIGFSKKLMKSTSESSLSDSSTNFQESNSKSSRDSVAEPGSNDFDLSEVEYTIIDTSTTNSFFSRRDNYGIKFFDNKVGKIYSHDSRFFFIIRDKRPQEVYYRSKESAIRSLYHYLSKNEILMDNIAFYKE